MCGLTEKSGDVTPSEAERSTPCTRLCRHCHLPWDFFSFLFHCLVLWTLAKCKQNITDFWQFCFPMGDKQNVCYSSWWGHPSKGKSEPAWRGIVDEVLRKGIKLCNKMTLEWTWQAVHGHLFSTSLATSCLFLLGKAKLRAAVAIETKQDGQYCRCCGCRSGIKRLSLCFLVDDLREF